MNVGQLVSAGQLIAFCGSTGNSTEPHCHFEVMINDNAVNPGLFVPGLLAAETAAGGGSGSSNGTADLDGGHINFEVNVDFAKPVRDLINQLVDTIAPGLSLIKSSVYKVFMALLTMDLCLGLMFRGFTDAPENKNEDLARTA